MAKISEKYFNPTFGKLYGTSILNSAVQLVDIPANQYNALLSGVGVIGGDYGNVRQQCCDNINTGLTLDVGATLASGLVIEFQDLVNGDGYTDGTTTDVAVTGGTGTSCTVDILVKGGRVKDVMVNNPGSGYTTANNLSISGTAGTSATVKVRSVQDNSITSISINAGGTGYTVGDIVMITTGEKNAVVKVSSTSTGVVDGVVLINGGSEYTASATAQTTKPIAGFYILYDGSYSIHSSLSFTDSTTTSHEVNGTMFVVKNNNSFVRLGGLSWTRTISASTVGSSSLAGCSELGAGDFVLYGFENLHSAATTLTLDNYSWSISRRD